MKSTFPCQGKGGAVVLMGGESGDGHPILAGPVHWTRAFSFPGIGAPGKRHRYTGSAGRDGFPQVSGSASAEVMKGTRAGRVLGKGAPETGALPSTKVSSPNG